MELKRKDESQTVDLLARAWFAEKKAGKQKSLRKDTFEKHRRSYENSRGNTSARRILDVSGEELVAYLESINAGHERRCGVKNMFSQFFNWCKNSEAHYPKIRLIITR
jgi:capsid portal protein